MLCLIAQGKSPEEVASSLGTSPKTVHNQLPSLKIKLGIQSTAGLVHYALHHDLVEMTG